MFPLREPTWYGRIFAYNWSRTNTNGQPGMVAQRLDVRLDEEYRRKLGAIASSRGARISDAVRELIDQAYEEVQRADRMRAAIALGELEIEDVPDPDAL